MQNLPFHLSLTPISRCHMSVWYPDSDPLYSKPFFHTHLSPLPCAYPRPYHPDILTSGNLNSKIVSDHSLLVLRLSFSFTPTTFAIYPQQIFRSLFSDSCTPPFLPLDCFLPNLDPMGYSSNHSLACFSNVPYTIL